MVLLDNDVFLTELTKLFTKTRTSGSVFLSFKKYEPKPPKEVKDEKKPGTTPTKKTIVKPPTPAEVEPRCLIRATNGKDKISTHVAVKDVVRFQLAYANILKSQMDNLKRKEKKKKKKSKKVAV